MHPLRRVFSACGAAFFVIALVTACGGSHSAGVSTLPTLPDSPATQLRAGDLGVAASGPVVAINAGGGSVANFVADRAYVASGTSTSKTTVAIDTSFAASPAPQAVYQDHRFGKTVTYTIPGLTAGATYTVRLDFAEFYWSAAGKRIFSVAINGASVLTNFDIFATAGGRYKAVGKSFTATATSSGTIGITMKASLDNASIAGIEIAAGGTSGPTPTPTSTPSFNDYTTFGYDNQRDVYNPNSTAITPATVANGKIHLGWQVKLGGGDYNTQSQPILATEIAGHKGVLFVGGGSGNVYAYDALTGKTLWTRATGQETYTCENNYTAYFGIGGSAAYDPASKSLYIVGNKSASPNTNSLFHLDGASGTITGLVNFAPPTSGWPSLDFSHTSVTLGSNGLAYVGTSATCDISSWRGRIAAVNTSSMTLAKTFYTVWNGGTQPWGGGGVWGWGGVSLDFSGNVLTGVGNTDDGSTTHGKIVAPFARAPKEYSGLGDALIAVSAGLTTLEASHHPIPTGAFGGNSADLDLNGTPVIFRPTGSGCDPLAALQAKSGALYIYDTTRIANGPVGSYQLAPSTYADGFLGGPAFSPATGLLYAAVPSSSNSLYAPGMIAINPGCGRPSVTWHSAFGPDSYPSGVPRSVPAVSAGGVVFVGTPCSPNGSGGCSASVASTTRRPAICCAPPGSEGGALWALDASTGAVLNGGLPVITTSGPLRVPPTIDGQWIFVLDNNGDLYGLTIDSGVPAIAATAHAIDARMLRRWQPPPAP